MLQSHSSLESSLQTLQDLADDLLGMGRPSQVDKQCQPTSVAYQHKIANNESTFNEHSTDDCEHKPKPTLQHSENITSSKASDYNICSSTNDNIYDRIRLSKWDDSKKKSPSTIEEVTSELQRASISSKRNNNHLYECQSPMINLKKLLERKNQQISNEQASEIAENLFHMEGLDKTEIVRHLLKK